MTDLPTQALSVRQPWAWAIVHAGKHLENRSWGGWNNHQKRRRGLICIHASTGMTRQEYEEAKDFMERRCGVICPPPHLLVRGAIIGTAKIVGWTTRSSSPWFMGPGALQLDEMLALPNPIPAGGKLGFFEWSQHNGGLPEPAKWMLPAADKPVVSTKDEPMKQEQLL